MSLLPDSTLGVQVEVIYQEPVGSRGDLVEEFLRLYNGRIAGIAAKLARQFVIRPEWRDECIQTVRMCTWQVLMGPKDPKVPVNEIFTIIGLRSRNEMSRLVQSTAYTGVSGLVSVQRRRSAVAQHRIRMSAEMGRELTDEEAVSSYNEKVMATRSNPGRQGALASLEDLEPPKLVHDPDHILLDRVSSDVAPEAIDVRNIVAEVIDRCRLGSIELGLVAETAIGGHLDNPGDFTFSIQEIAQRTGLTRNVVSRNVKSVQSMLIAELTALGLGPDSFRSSGDDSALDSSFGDGVA